MRISIALPLAAALAAAVGLSSTTPAQAKGKTIAACKSEATSCNRNCTRYTEASSRDPATIAAPQG